MSPDERDKVELEDIEFKVDTDKEINLDDIATDSPENLKAQAQAEAEIKAQQAQQIFDRLLKELFYLFFFFEYSLLL